MTIRDEKLTQLHYKNGELVAFSSHLQDSDWYRGVDNIGKSRKSFKCTFGCDINKGSKYTSLSMQAGEGRLDGFVDFALCEKHSDSTQSLLGKAIDEAEAEDVLRTWLLMLDQL